MRRWLPLGLLAFAVALAVAACGGGSTMYTYSKTKACLAKLNLKLKPIDPAVDFTAWSAPGGSFSVVLPHNEVAISFGTTQQEADNLVVSYRKHHGRNIGIDDILRPQKNAVLLWRAHPVDQDISTVGGCLK